MLPTLLLFGFVLMFLLWQIGTLDFSEPGLKIESKPVAGTGPVPAPPSSPNPNSGTAADAAPTEKRPILSELFPQVAPGAVPVVYITASGGELTVTDTATKGTIKVSVVGSNGEAATKDLEIT
jgi:hypothetical protein